MAYLKTGHKNMLRKVTAGIPWAGPPGAVYTADQSNNPLDFTLAKIGIGGVQKDLYYVFDGWMGEGPWAPRALYDGGFNNDPASSNYGKPNISYSCGRCHATGWTSDASIQTSRKPESEYPGITWNGVLFSNVGKINLAGGITGDTNKYSSWVLNGIQCERCHDATNHLTQGKPGVTKPTGSAATALCMDCHRQETGGLPWYPNTPGTTLQVGAHGVYGPEFDSHPHGNQFLNSPHARFSGTSTQINSAPSGPPYESHFYYYGGGCTTCHEVHQSTVEAVNAAAPIKNECGVSCHQARILANMNHPSGTGTPLGDMTDIPKACETCHMPDGLHLFRISVNGSYTTFPTAPTWQGGSCNDPTKTTQTACAGGDLVWTPAAQSKIANTSADGDFAGAVWVGMEIACGQCHGGGNVQARTSGSIESGKTLLTVASTTGLKSGQLIKVAGAGSGGSDLKTHVVNVGSGAYGDQVTLFDAASTTVSGATVVGNPTELGVPYFSSGFLSLAAKNIHNSIPVVKFTWSADTVTSFKVSFDGSSTTCPVGATCNFTWDFGDTTTATGVTASHTYVDAVPKTVCLTVDTTGTYYTSAKECQTVTPVYLNTAPVASRTTPVVTGMTASFTDTSTDNEQPTSELDVAVNWGDGMTSAGKGGQTFTHTYALAGTYTIRHSVTDKGGLSSSSPNVSVTIAEKYSISGTVTEAGSGLSGVSVYLKQGTTVKRTVKTIPDGTYGFANLLKGCYYVQPAMTGKTFTPVQQTVCVGPSKTGIDFTAAP
jgi:PKD repeat protein